MRAILRPSSCICRWVLQSFQACSRQPACTCELNKALLCLMKQLDSLVKLTCNHKGQQRYKTQRTTSDDVCIVRTKSASSNTTAVQHFSGTASYVLTIHCSSASYTCMQSSFTKSCVIKTRACAMLLSMLWLFTHSTSKHL